MVEQANFSELRNKIANWDIEAEEMLINKMRIFTNAYKSEFALFTQNMQNLNSNLSNAQVQNYKAISNLQELSMNQFIEETMEEKSESVSEESEKGFETNPNKEVFLDQSQKMKAMMDISMKNLSEINAKKEKNKEKIEDDAVSVSSKSIALDNLKKKGLPFIIGTQDFMNDKNIGLIDATEEEDKKDGDNKSEDSGDKEVENFLSDNKIGKLNRQLSNNQKAEEIKNDFDFEIIEKVDIPKEYENNEGDVKNEQKEQVIADFSGNEQPKVSSTVPPPPSSIPPPVPVYDPNQNVDNKKIEEEKNIQNEIVNNNNNNNNITNNYSNTSNINKSVYIQPPNKFLMAGLKTFEDEDDEEDEDDGGLFGKNKIAQSKINIQYNSPFGGNQIIPQQNNFGFNQNNYNNYNTAVNNNNINLNNNFNYNNNTIQQNKLDNIFGEGEGNEVDQKVKDENDLNNQFGEEQKVYSDIKENNENNEVKQNVIEKIPSQQINKNKILNGLFSSPEEEKNNNEIIKPVSAEIQQNKKVLETKKKMTLFFQDDDE